MALPPARVIYSSLFFVLTMLLLVARPRALFEPDGRAREFGTGGVDGRTVFPVGVVDLLNGCIQHEGPLASSGHADGPSPQAAAACGVAAEMTQPPSYCISRSFTHGLLFHPHRATNPNSHPFIQLV